MNITQTFYDNMASQYDKLFLDWEASTKEQAVILSKVFNDNGFDQSASILDCACGIGTQAIGLAVLGYNVTASDISEGELEEAENELKKMMCRFVLSMRISVPCQKPLKKNLTSLLPWIMLYHTCLQRMH